MAGEEYDRNREEGNGKLDYSADALQLYRDRVVPEKEGTSRKTK